MSNESRIYSFSQSEVMSRSILSLFGIVMLAGAAWFENNYPPLAALGAVGIIFAVWRSSRLKTVITDDGISTQGVFGKKSLRWNEISRVSGRGNDIRLHNHDEDVNLAPSIELPDYEEIIETIGQRRPDLFSSSLHPVFNKTAEYAVILPLVALLPIALGIYIWSRADEFGIIFFAVFLVAGLAVFGFSFSAPQTVKIEGGSLRVRHLWGEKTFSVAEVQSIELAYQNSRNSKNYYVRLKLPSQTAPKLFGLAPSMPIVYLVLKNWHRKPAQT
jgi:hypothetical protein